MLVKRTQLARVLGCSVRQVGSLEADGVIVAARRGKAGRASLFDLTVVVPACLRRELAKQDDPAINLERERALLAREQRRKAQFENRKRAGELLERADIVIAGKAYTIAWRSAVLQLPHKLTTAGIIPPEREADVKTACRDLLTDIASWKTDADLEHVNNEFTEE